MSCDTKKARRVCPKTGKVLHGEWKYRWLKWLFPLTGIGALIWFLIRVIPKPSRATYPCQKVAFPVASSFIAYILGLGAVTLAMKKAQQRLHQARYVLAAVCVAVALTCAWLTISINSQKAKAAPFVPTDPPNSPMGVAKGIYPGRVAFVRDANATDWIGTTDGYYWDDTHTNQAVVDQIMDKVLRALTNEPTDEAVWDVLFRYFNLNHGKGNIGYTPGEKIRIKPNNVDARYHARVNNLADTTPQVVLSLLRQLVYKAGVPQEDITLGDTSRYVPNKIFDRCHAEFPDVVYEETDFYIDNGDDRGTDPNRIMAVLSAEPLIFYSDISDSNGFENDIKDKLPMSYVNASYVINLGGFKGHAGGGVTVCAKNWYGCFGGRGPHDIQHNTLANLNPNMGQYRLLVDLMGHEHLGGKTMLYLADGIWGTKWHNTVPEKWSMAPFNNDYTSCLFASQDPVAIDSVCLDFLYTQWADVWDDPPRYLTSGFDDYMHEAALANNPPSGTFYDPHHPLGSIDKVRLPSLGVHEHWNNEFSQQYSRNLETGSGIELATSALLSCSAGIEGDVNGDCEVNYEDLQIIAENWLTPQPEARFGDLYDDDMIDFRDFAVMAADWAACNILPSGNCDIP